MLNSSWHVVKLEAIIIIPQYLERSRKAGSLWGKDQHDCGLLRNRCVCLRVKQGGEEAPGSLHLFHFLNYILFVCGGERVKQ